MQTKNLYYSGFEFFVTTVVQFMTFKIVASTLGPGQLGIWSLLMASVQTAKLFDPGLASGSVRFMVAAQRDGDLRFIASLASAGILFTAVMFGLALTVSYFPLLYFLKAALPNSYQDATPLLIYAILSFYAQTICGVIYSTVINIGFSRIKNVVSAVGLLLQLAASVFLIKSDGLRGLAVAQIVNSGFCLIVLFGFLITRGGLKFSYWLKPRLHGWKQIVSTGMGLQLNSIIWTAFEVLSRFFMARFAGAEIVGYYEVASRAAVQMRVLLYYIYQPMIPEFYHKHSDGRLKDYFAAAYRVTASVAGLFVVVAILITPLIYLLIFGEIKIMFLVFSVLCMLGAYAHILSMPGESVATAMGQVRWNAAGNLIKLATLATIGYFLASQGGPTGVAVAIFVSVICGALATLYLNATLFELPVWPNFTGVLLPAYWTGLVHNFRNKT